MKKIIFALVATLFPLILFPKPKLNDFNKIVYSQFGEDGIIEKIFEIIGEQSKTCLEFGAADGFNCSNTANLFQNKGWKAILIEGNHGLATDLKKNVAPFNCLAMERMVEATGTNSLDAILAEHNISEPLDLLSIDIDGNDYYILSNLTTRPRVIICEYNPTFPSEYDIYGDPGSRCGCSVKALKRIADQKGYKLIAITHCNAFFVVEEEYHKFEAYETALEKIKVDEAVKYVITDYDGRYTVLGHPASASYKKAGFHFSRAKMPNVIHGDFLKINTWTVTT